MTNGRGELVDPAPNMFGRYCRYWPLDCITKKSERMQYYDGIISRFRKDRFASREKRGVMVYVHGGLNTQVSSIERAALLRQRMEDDPSHHFFSPIFINWQSSLVASYWDHLVYIRQGKDWRETWAKRVSFTLMPLYLASDVVRAVGHAPLAWCMQIANVRHILIRWEDQMEPARARWRTRPVKYAIKEGKEPATNVLDIAENGLSAVIFLPVRMLLTPFINALGSSSWDNMNRGTSMLFDRDKDFETMSFKDPPTGPLAECIDMLARQIEKSNQELKRSSKDHTPIQVTLIGHSMGTIIVNQIIRRYGDQLPISNIVYMAAACSVRDYQDTVFPYMERHPHVQMYHLVLHDLAEINERPVRQPDFVPRGSLLLWVDNFLAKPDTRRDRTAGRFLNLIMADHLAPPNLQSRIHIKQFDWGRQLTRVQPQKHGDFGQFTFWREAFWDPEGTTDEYEWIEKKNE